MSMTAYQELLLDYSPRPVRNEREYRRTMRSIERLMNKPKLSRAESELLELLATLASARRRSPDLADSATEGLRGWTRNRRRRRRSRLA